jgi:hypothetical protein
LKDEAANHKGSALNIELDEESFLIANYEFAHLNNQDSKYTVMPAQQADNLQRKDICTQSYKCLEARSQAKKSAESSKNPEEKKPSNDEPPIRKILQCIEPTQNEDIEMESDPEPPKTKPIMKEPMNMNSVKKHLDSKHELMKRNKPKNITFEEVEIIEPPTKTKGMDKPKYASPSFKFSSMVQESINQDELLERILDEPVKVTFRDLLGSYEIVKRVQSITKSQKIPFGSPNMSTNLNMRPPLEKIAHSSKVMIEDVSDEDLTSKVTRIGFRHGLSKYRRIS